MPLRTLKIACLAALALMAVVALSGLGGARGNDLVGNWLHNVLMVLAAGIVVARVVARREERLAWSCLAAALAAYAAGEIVWNLAYSGPAEPPYPSAADALWLAFYPLSYAGVILLVRARVQEFHASLWLDGLLAALVCAALGSVLLFGTILDATEGSRAAVATTLAYPLGDIVLLGSVAGVFALTSWRPGRSWMLIGAGLALNGVADAIYSYQSALGTWTDGSIWDALFPAAALMIGFAAWAPPARSRIDMVGWRVFAIPALFMAAGLGVAAYGLFHGVNALAAALVLAAAATVMVRFGVTFAEHLGLLRASRHEATTDQLTGLCNRRALMRDLPRALEAATTEEPRALCLFDLDGFKRYNDTFGHPAGDALLARLGSRLDAAVAPYGTAYRLGGDEFCMVFDAGGVKRDVVLAAATRALSERGDGFHVTASHGLVLMPFEADDPRRALQLADQRMYREKEGRSSSPGRQARDMLMGLLKERQPGLHDHLNHVAVWARRVGERMGMDPEQLDELTRAAELHDIGKIAVPDAILDKPGPLDEAEWRFMRRHTLVGERILGAAEALRPVGRIVRSSHERWDGAGYPDGLAGERIPLGSRIVFVCDAFDAMIADRPYRPARTHAEALAELRRGAGTQFDPKVVDAFVGVVEEQGLTQVWDGAAARSVASKSEPGMGPTHGDVEPAAR